LVLSSQAIPAPSVDGIPKVVVEFETLSDAMLAVRMMKGMVLEGVMVSANLI